MLQIERAPVDGPVGAGGHVPSPNPQQIKQAANALAGDDVGHDIDLTR